MFISTSIRTSIRSHRAAGAGVIATVTAWGIVCGLTPAYEARAATEPGYSYCIRFDTQSNNLTAFMLNSCDMQLLVRWTDQGDCSGWRCAVPIGPHGKQSIGRVRGNVEVAACRYPISAQIHAGGFSCSQ